MYGDEVSLMGIFVMIFNLFYTYWLQFLSYFLLTFVLQEMLNNETKIQW